MSPKDDFAQAMKELLDGGDSATNTEEKKTVVSSFSSFGRNEPKPVPPSQRPEYQQKEEETKVKNQNVNDSYNDTTASSDTEPTVESTYNPYNYAVPTTTYTEPVVTTDEVTVIATGTKIVGDIDTAGGLRINGSVKGNIKVASTLELNGKVIGDIEAEDIRVTISAIRGNVSARNVINVDKDTTIVGDVSAKNAEVDGKIKGNLTVAERAHIESDSILVGNLISGTVNIEEGAMLKGDITITNTQTDIVTVDEPEFDINI